MSADIIELPRRSGTGGFRLDGAAVIAFPVGGRRELQPAQADDSDRAFFMDEGNWRRSQKGNLYINIDGYNLVVFRRGGGFAWRVENQLTGRVLWGERDWPTVRDGMADAWARR
jgi:hypothetical protein